MKNPQLKLITFSLALVANLLAGTTAAAWGPERPTYTMDDPAEHATFNSIIDNPGVGDERDFVRVAEVTKDGSALYRSDIAVEPDKEYEVYIYYHNDASSTYNDEAHGFVGVARDTRLAVSFPLTLKAGQRAAINGTITSSSTDPAAVWDEAYITATEDMTLHYVAASAKIYNKWGTNGSVLSTSLFSQQGTYLGSSQLTGVILGCDEYSGHVILRIQTKSVPAGEEPVPENPVTPEVPEDPTPEELPKTGPAEVVLLVVVVLALTAGGIYWYRTHATLKRATRRARGRK